MHASCQRKRRHSLGLAFYRPSASILRFTHRIDRFATKSTLRKGFEMKRYLADVREGKAGWILLWLLGVPIPILLILFAIRGCT
jgi:hypothetical protein